MAFQVHSLSSRESSPEEYFLPFGSFIGLIWRAILLCWGHFFCYCCFHLNPYWFIIIIILEEPVSLDLLCVLGSCDIGRNEGDGWTAALKAVVLVFLSDFGNHAKIHAFSKIFQD